MGNLSTCCYGAEAENKETSPLDTQEVNQNRVKAQEKAVPNYQSIVDHAATQFLPSKPRYRTETSSGQNMDSLETIKGKIDHAVVDPLLACSPQMSNRNVKSTDSIVLESLRPSVGNKISLDASLKIAELVTNNQIPNEYYPIDTFNPVNVAHR